MLGKGVCAHSALPWGLITSAATKQPASYLLYKRLVSLQGEIFKEYSMIVLLRYEQFVEWHCTQTAQPLGEVVWLPSGYFPALPSVRRQGLGTNEWWDSFLSVLRKFEC